MIRLEGGVLVLDAPISKEDAEAVQEFAKHIKEQEQERIIELLPEIIEMGNVADVFSLSDFMPAILRDAIALIKGEK